ncbi:MAG: hypothetical protein JWN69_1221 [Alphaproteobacteria bacterium]|nr:hypothetical protein [Alphaproteobacteria bacterium]
MPRDTTPLPGHDEPPSEDEVRRRLRRGIERSRALISQYRARLAVLDLARRECAPFR